MSKIKEMERAAINIRNIGKTKTINVAKLPPAVTKLRKNYAFTVRVEATTADGMSVRRFVQVGFDNPGMTPTDVLTKAEEAIRAAEDYNIHNIDSLTIETGTASSNPLITG